MKNDNKAIKFYILIPTYNPGNVFIKCLKSCVNQTYRNLSITVSDDSTDDFVLKTIEFFNDNRISYTRNKVRLGAVENWNHLLNLRPNCYSKLLHQDDYFSTKDAVSSIIYSFTSNPSIQVVINSHYVVDVSDTTIKTTILDQSKYNKILADPYSLIWKNTIGSPSNISMRGPLNLLYDESLKWYVDVDAYLRMLATCHVGFTELPLVCSVSGSPRQISRSLENDLFLQAKELLYIINKHDAIRFLSLKNHLQLFRLILKTQADILQYKHMLYHTPNPTIEIILLRIILDTHAIVSVLLNKLRFKSI